LGPAPPTAIPPKCQLSLWTSSSKRSVRNDYDEDVYNGDLGVVSPIDIEADELHAHDVYAVGAEKDHIVPWQAAWRVAQLVGGSVRFVLASSGHIAGIINPPGGKSTYWAVEPPARFESPEAWRGNATKHDGSWWMDWFNWLSERSGKLGAPPTMGSAMHPPARGRAGQLCA
jgi:polyhydroxyalkanoate synthase